MAKNRFSKAWLDQHRNDPYVKQAQARGYRSRAAFKLIEIDELDRLVRPGSVVVDLGSAPGAWSQVLRERLATGAGGIRGRILALDMLPMEPVADVYFIQGDFREQAVLEQLEQALGGQKVDLVLSDIAPNLSGIPTTDAARIEDIVELAIDFSRHHLKPSGCLLVKCFNISGYTQIVEKFRQEFRTVSPKKPKASRDKSSEVFLLGRGLKHPA